MKLPNLNLLFGVLLITSTSTSSAFTPQHQNGAFGTKLHNSSNNDNNNNNDPTNNLPTAIANSIQKIFTNFNPLNDGKKKLVQSLAGNYDKPKIQNELQSLIQNEPLLMLSFTKWPFCVKAKQILSTKGLTSNSSYTVLELDAMDDGYAYRAEMAEIINRTSVPAIWINGVFIGGCNDGGENGQGLVQLENSGKLDVLLKEAGLV